jgi:hypothetical protein
MNKMSPRYYLLLVLLLSPAGCTTQEIQTALNVASESGLLEGKTQDGIKQILELSSGRASDALNQSGAYANDPATRITLPEQWQAVAGTLRTFGQGEKLDRIENLMNQAAEQAAGEAKGVFMGSIRDMSIADAVAIATGPQDAATQFFRTHSEAQLRARYQPIIASHLSKTGFYDQYRSFLSIYNTLPIPNKINLDIEDYVLQKSLDGLFKRMAREEGLIRQDPMGRGGKLISTILQRG